MQRLSVVLALATAVAACGPGTGAPQTTPADLLATLPACTDTGLDTVDLDVDVVLPPGTAVHESTAQGPLTLLTGQIGMTPPEIRAWYETASDVIVLTSEDEILEVELLFTDRVTRAYLKGVARCRTGTALTIVVADELEGAPDLVPEGAFQTGGG